MIYQEGGGQNMSKCCIRSFWMPPNIRFTCHEWATSVGRFKEKPLSTRYNGNFWKMCAPPAIFLTRSAPASALSKKLQMTIYELKMSTYLVLNGNMYIFEFHYILCDIFFKKYLLKTSKKYYQNARTAIGFSLNSFWEEGLQTLHSRNLFPIHSQNSDPNPLK